jgi:NAD+ kinase
VKRIGVLTNPHYPQTQQLATEIQESLGHRSIEVICSTAAGEEAEALLSSNLELLITLGGDGTMLRAAHLVAASGTPILGIHMGRLGFLAEVRSADWEASLDDTLAGRFWVEERSMVCARLERDGARCGPWEALNEVVIGRGGISRVVQLATYVDGGYFTTYVADGLIVATATGSTAYALSAGGPILPPELRNMLLVPICPHLSLERTIVLDEGAEVSVRVESAAEGLVVVDGTAQASLNVGDQILLTMSPHVTRFVRLCDRRQVYESLMERLQPRKVIKPNDGR